MKLDLDNEQITQLQDALLRLTRELTSDPDFDSEQTNTWEYQQLQLVERTLRQVCRDALEQEEASEPIIAGGAR